MSDKDRRAHDHWSDQLLAVVADKLLERLASIECKLDHILRMEARQMAFSQDVLDRIARQTTIIGSIKTWIQALPSDVATAEEKTKILANLDANETELNTVIPANTPVDPNAGGTGPV